MDGWLGFALFEPEWRTDNPLSVWMGGWLARWSIAYLPTKQVLAGLGIANYLPTNQPTTHFLYGWVGGWCVVLTRMANQPTNHPRTSCMDRWVVGVLADCLAAHQAGGGRVGINKLYKISDKCITSKKNKNTQ